MSNKDEYGYNKSVMEAIEELGIACMLNGMKPPQTMIFDKESLDKLTLQFKSKERYKLNTKEQSESKISLVNTSAGRIQFEETEDLSKKIFKAVEDDLRGRRGIRQEWDQADEETKKEIRDTNTANISKVLEPK